MKLFFLYDTDVNRILENPYVINKLKGVRTAEIPKDKFFLKSNLSDEYIKQTLYFGGGLEYFYAHFNYVDSRTVSKKEVSSNALFDILESSEEAIKDSDEVMAIINYNNNEIDIYRQLLENSEKLKKRFHLIIVFEEKFKSDTLQEALYEIPEVNRCTSVSIISIYDYLKSNSRREYYSKYICLLQNIVDKAKHINDYSKLNIYNHKAEDFTGIEIDTNKIKPFTAYQTDYASYKWESIVPHNKEFCRYLTKLRQEYAKKIT